jgi:hypothetical protein
MVGRYLFCEAGMSYSFRAGFVVATWASVTVTAWGQTTPTPVEWIADGNGAWSDATAWSIGIVPQDGTPKNSTYDVTLGPAANPYTITIDRYADVTNIKLTSAQATLRLPYTNTQLLVDNTLDLGEGTLKLNGGLSAGLVTGGVIEAENSYTGASGYIVSTLLRSPLNVLSGCVSVIGCRVEYTVIDTTTGFPSAVSMVAMEDVIFDSVTLRGDFSSVTGGLEIYNDLRLDGTLALNQVTGGATMLFRGDAHLTGACNIDIPPSSIEGGVYLDILDEGLTFGSDVSLNVRQPAANIWGPSAAFVNQGHINLTDAALSVRTNTFHNTATGVIAGTGSLNLTGCTLINDGAISPGLSPGTLTINGDATLSATSSLRLEMGHTNHDVLAVGGALVLGGTFHLQAINGENPELGDAFTLLDCDNITGHFAGIQGIRPDPELAFAVLYQNDGILVRASIPGDANTDDKVNLDDFYLLRDAFGAGDIWALGEFTGDGRIDLAEFYVLYDFFGRNDESVITPTNLAMLDTFAASVPEPMSAAVLVILLGVASQRRHRSHSR